ncbi:unnamed protein product [Euphydryas editha]|uniref:Uncharacterized protein n=1 Tax=Euphydryas editha TaxID=104508 RepID=A0AAU9UTY7_EUPED|nr:unnamed protein product [Euphydryas editha]
MPSAQASASPEQKAFSKKVRKLVRRDLHCFIYFQIPLERSLLAKLKTVDGRIACSCSQIREEIEKFYGLLVSSSAHKQSLLAPFSDDIPDIDVSEISAALGQLKDGLASGDDEIPTELLKATG